MKAQSEGRQGTSSPTQAFFGHLQSCTSYVAGSIGAQDHVDDSGRGKSGKDFWMLILDSNEETLLRVTFSKSICNVLFKLFDVAIVFT